ncbi:MAG: ATP-binding protein [Pirellulaceae bacterium]|nr:ATP-binding protein [Pirellulaceae bacterium]
MSPRLRFWITLSAGATLVALSAIVLTGWVLHIESLLRVLPAAPPMRFNTALCFGLTGSALCCLAVANWRMARVCGAATTLLALLTLSQYALPFNLGIDNLFFTDWSGFGPNPPGRMAFNTAICLVLLGLATVSQSFPGRHGWQYLFEGLCGSTVFAAAAVAAFGYGSGLTAAYGWGGTLGMAIHTAVAMLVGGAVITTRAISRALEERVPPSWLPLPAGIAVVTGTIVLWQALVLRELVELDRTTELHATNLARQLEERLTDRQNALARMAARWSRGGQPEYSLWQADTENYMRHYPDIQALAWTDAAGKIQWIVPTKGNEPAKGLNVLFEPRRREAYAAAERTGRPQITRTIDLVQGGRGVVGLAPIIERGDFRGCLACVFRIDRLMKQATAGDLARDYRVAVFDGDQQVYGPTLDDDSPAKRDREQSLAAHLPWRLQVWPTFATVRAERSRIPELVLLVGLVVAALVTLVVHFWRQARRQTQLAEEAAVALRISEDHLATAVRGSAQGLWDADLVTGKIHHSPYCKVMLGYQEEDPVDRLEDWSSRVHPGDLPAVQEALADHLRRRVPYDVEYRYYPAPSKLRWFRARARAIWDEHGRAIRIAGSVVDVTDRKRMEAELRTTLGELSASNEELQRLAEVARSATAAKSDFLANMSHEIRSPLTAVLGFAELLQDECSSPEARDAVSRIRRNGEHLLQVINDILDLSKIEAGKLDVDPAPCDLARLLSEIMLLWEGRCQDKGVRLSLDYVSLIPAAIQTDPLRLKQILLNLVGNAVKFTSQGQVRIVVRCQAERAQLTIDVYDTGIGMTREELARVFQPFTQADGSTTRRFGGTGLGLSISQRLAELLQGKITATSTPGQGSVFRLVLPIGIASRAPWIDAGAVPPADDVTADSKTIARPTTLARTVLSGRRILLAEDVDDNRRLAVHLLERAGAKVETVENGEQAVRRACAAVSAGQPFDVILLDMQMPVLDGYSAARQLRDQHYDLPIIALTAHAMADDREKCLNAGCSDYVTKPIDQAALLATIARWLAPCEADIEGQIAQASRELTLLPHAGPLAWDSRVAYRRG